MKKENYEISVWNWRCQLGKAMIVTSFVIIPFNFIGILRWYIPFVWLIIGLPLWILNLKYIKVSKQEHDLFELQQIIN